MARTARSNEEIEKTKEHILDQALEIIGEEGYDSLSMRKLGDRLGCAAKTIYNYFSSKEEIYIRVLTRGFEMLYVQAEAALEGTTDPLEKLRILSAVYISFGMENANYYNIMFNWDVPKYTDYIDTVLEPVAREEKEVAFYFARAAEEALAEILKNTEDPEGQISFQVIRLWSGLHGLVSLYNSHGFREYVANPEQYIYRIANDLLSDLANLRSE
ncbi:MAG: TetR/AcrR family transcriptional regulator [Syntrophomonadaceae bacterium]|jgi:AcrR family transcriptional regulator|nr:TetR/AcrR family transcriptional regulator [Syntrophomonadaceae bacterium]